MADKAVQESGCDQRVFQVVFLFQQVRSKPALSVVVNSVPNAVPNVPLIKAKVGTLFELLSVSD